MTASGLQKRLTRALTRLSASILPIVVHSMLSDEGYREPTPVRQRVSDPTAENRESANRAVPRAMSAPERTLADASTSHRRRRRQPRLHPARSSRRSLPPSAAHSPLPKVACPPKALCAPGTPSLRKRMAMLTCSPASPNRPMTRSSRSECTGCGGATVGKVARRYRGWARASRESERKATRVSRSALCRIHG
jgi:hypothetical protein